MNPWKIDAIEMAKRMMRASFWVCLMAVALMAGVGLVRIGYLATTHIVGWLERTLFDKPW